VARTASFILGGATRSNQQLANLELLGTQKILRESDVVPQMDSSFGYNHSNTMSRRRMPTEEFNKSQLGLRAKSSQTITIASVDNGLGDRRDSFERQLAIRHFATSGPFIRGTKNKRDHQPRPGRVELTAKKSLFRGPMVSVGDQVLAGYSELYNKVASDNSQTIPTI